MIPQSTYLYCSKFSVQNYNFGSSNKRFTWIQRYSEVHHNATSQDTVLHCDKNASLARNALKMLSKQTHLELQTSRGSKIPAHDWLLSLFSKNQLKTSALDPNRKYTHYKKVVEQLLSGIGIENFSTCPTK